MLAAANSLPPNWRLILGDGKKTAATITREHLKVLSGGGMDEAMTRALQEAKDQRDARLVFIEKLREEADLLKPAITAGGALEHSTRLFLTLIEQAAHYAQKARLTRTAQELRRMGQPPSRGKWTHAGLRAYFLTLPAILKWAEDETQELYQEELAEIERTGQRKTGRRE